MFLSPSFFISINVFGKYIILVLATNVVYSKGAQTILFKLNLSIEACTEAAKYDQEEFGTNHAASFFTRFLSSAWYVCL